MGSETFAILGQHLAISCKW